MTWAEATDDQLRRAAAGVCEFWYSDDYVYLGSFYPPPIGWPHKTGRFGSGSYILCRAAKWRPHKNRDDLARVFAAARNRITERGYTNDEEIRSAAYDQLWAAWDFSLDDPRAALAGLLDLLFPEGPER